MSPQLRTWGNDIGASITFLNIWIRVVGIHFPPKVIWWWFLEVPSCFFNFTIFINKSFTILIYLINMKQAGLKEIWLEDLTEDFTHKKRKMLKCMQVHRSVL